MRTMYLRVYGKCPQIHFRVDPSPFIHLLWFTYVLTLIISFLRIYQIRSLESIYVNILVFSRFGNSGLYPNSKVLAKFRMELFTFAIYSEKRPDARNNFIDRHSHVTVAITWNKTPQNPALSDSAIVFN